MLALENMRVLVGLDRKMTLSFDVCPESTGALKAVYDSLKNTRLSCEIKKYRNKRSLDANAALWKMLGEMAAALKTSKDELYLEMLKRYGTFTHVIVKPCAVEKFMREYKTAVSLGEVTVNGQTGVQLQCYFGSSTMDSKEFSVLLDGVISEAKELGIQFISRADRDLMLKEWGAK